MTQQKSHILMLLDSSGSMEPHRKTIISGFNEQLQAIADGLVPSVQTTLTLITFDSQQYAQNVFDDPLKVTPLSEATYQPRGGTALHDTVKHVIELCQKYADMDDPDTSFLLTIFTDGEDMNSRCDKKALAEHLQDLVDTGRWTVSYIGPNTVDLTKIQADFAVAAGNATTFNVNDTFAAAAAMSTHTRALGAYTSMRAKGCLNVSNMYSGDASADPQLTVTGAQDTSGAQPYSGNQGDLAKILQSGAVGSTLLGQAASVDIGVTHITVNENMTAGCAEGSGS